MNSINAHVWDLGNFFDGHNRSAKVPNCSISPEDYPQIVTHFENATWVQFEWFGFLWLLCFVLCCCHFHELSKFLASVWIYMVQVTWKLSNLRIKSGCRGIRCNRWCLRMRTRTRTGRCLVQRMVIIQLTLLLLRCALAYLFASNTVVF